MSFGKKRESDDQADSMRSSGTFGGPENQKEVYTSD